MPKVRRTAIPNPEWEGHRATIKRLYLDEKTRLEGEKGVMSIMATQHGFCASKSQYEVRFKKWGFRKNIKKEEWQIIGSICRQKKEEGRSIRVFFYGEVISQEKIHKETARYKNESLIQNPGPDQLPEGVTICDSPCRPSSPRLSAFPDAEVGNTVDDTEAAIVRRSAVFPSSPLGNFSPTNFANIWSRSPTPRALFDGTGWSPMEPGNWNIHFAGAESSHTFENGLLAHTTIPTDTLSLAVNLSTSISPGLYGLNNKIRDLLRSCDKTTSPLLSQQSQQSLMVNGPDMIFISLIIHLLMNNFANSKDHQFQALFRQLPQFTISQAQTLLNSIPQPYSTALEQSILTIAIKYGATAIVRAMLNRGMDVNRARCQEYEHYILPIELACKYRHVKIVQLLLKSGANADGDIPSVSTTLRYLLLWKREDESSESAAKILELLLRAGATLDHFIIIHCRLWEDELLLEVFLSYARPLRGHDLSAGRIDSTFGAFFNGGIFEDLIHLRTEVQAIKFLEIFFGNEFQDLDPIVVHDLGRAIDYAVNEGKEKIFKFLFDVGFKPSPVALGRAVRQNNVIAVLRSLRFGVNTNDVYHFTNDPGEIKFSETAMARFESLLREDEVRNFCSSFETTAFAEAIRYERTELLALFSETEPSEDIDEYDKERIALISLCAASGVGNVTMVKELLKRMGKPRGMQKYYSGTSQSSCISHATVNNHVDVVQILLEAGFQPDYPVISAAIIAGNSDLLRLYLNIGVKVNHSDGSLWLAVRSGSEHMVRDLIESGARINYYADRVRMLHSFRNLEGAITTPLLEALKMQNQSMAQLLIKNGAKLHGADGPGHTKSNRCSALTVAVQSGNEGMVREVLTLGADPNDPDALLAAASEMPNMVHIIIDAFNETYQGRKVYFGSRTMLQAILDGNVKQVSLLAKYTDINSIEEECMIERDYPDHPIRLQYSLFGKAISCCSPQIIQTLLDFGGDPNSTVALDYTSLRPERRTALLEAIRAQELPLVQLIYNAGANVNCAATLGILWTPLQFAVKLGNTDIVDFLLRNGADVNAPPCVWGGRTALQLAAFNGHVGTAELLLKYGADINEPRGRFQGRTAFEKAAEHGRMDMLLFLHHKGIDLISDDGEQVRRAIELAEINGQLAAKSLVEQLSNAARVGFLET